MSDGFLARLPRAFRRHRSSMHAQQAGGALVLAAIGGVLAYATRARRLAAAAAQQLPHPEAPVIVWEG